MPKEQVGCILRTLQLVRNAHPIRAGCHSQLWVSGCCPGEVCGPACRAGQSRLLSGLIGGAVHTCGADPWGQLQQRHERRRVCREREQSAVERQQQRWVAVCPLIVLARDASPHPDPRPRQRAREKIPSPLLRRGRG